MSGKPFAARPPGAEAWVQDQVDRRGARPSPFTARLTIDVTPACRARIKIAAFARGQTVADMVRALLDREFPEERA
ncbi:hypothetical protein J2800_001015 [Caulobacter rhizosphaerae]|uniref:Plasmid segregation centromere-binding protein ParG n=1 Tax=Caulobacter rhizosphaerae TaxID=2010972 RepID=A0ABU1MVS5_9CAUL|nr:hypothetical protein [Caulobacter rhizosphaerae]MDR6530279.1 hypothetical protein [Caulobacter rhizosphaerae]